MATVPETALDLATCDREPIHLSGAIQPHGVLLVADARSLAITQAAGDTGEFLGRELPECLGLTLAELLGPEAAQPVALLTSRIGTKGYVETVRGHDGSEIDLIGHVLDDRLIIELERAPLDPMAASRVIASIEDATRAFETAADLAELWDRAARELRSIIGFDRVMIYRFLDDGAGCVVAEDRAAHLAPFLNHHFPASDIPRQARALYVRNVIRVIPDVSYTPMPIVPAAEAPLDMSDCVLRSVSPIHIQYLKNMGVAASMSVSIVRGEALWGLIACHHGSPRYVPFKRRAVCRVLAGILSQQIAAKEAEEAYAQTTRLRDGEDELLRLFAEAGSVEGQLVQRLPDLMRVISATGVAVCREEDITMAGLCPSRHQIRELLDWLSEREPEVHATSALSREHAPGAAFTSSASGLLSALISREKRSAILWFRAEQIEIVNWSGDPHKPVEPGRNPGTLNPRKSFEIWQEIVRGRSRSWSAAEFASAERLRAAILDLQRKNQIRALNAELRETLAEKERLLALKEFLIREVDHRVQNSLQIVGSLLSLQRRETIDPVVQVELDKARNRITAIALVHRRLYRSDQLHAIRLDRYLRDLRDEFVQSLTPEWDGQVRLHAAPVLIPTDRAVNLALVITELLTNAVKYAYDGGVGPIEIRVEEESPGTARVVIADRGRGRSKVEPQGFGTRLVDALIAQCNGTVEIVDNEPGTWVVISVPIA